MCEEIMVSRSYYFKSDGRKWKSRKLNPRSSSKAHVGSPSSTLPCSADSGAVACAKGVRKESCCSLSTVNDWRGTEVYMKQFVTVTTVKC